jgi:hypothetical protein
MFSKWFKPQSESVKPQASEPVVKDTSLKLTLAIQGEEVVITFSDNSDGNLENLNNMAIVLNALSDGLLDDKLAEAVVEGTTLERAHAIINGWNALRNMDEEEYEDEPVVQPSNVFKEAQ